MQDAWQGKTRGRRLLDAAATTWLLVAGSNCRAMFIATQFVKPTLNGNNVPFFSLSLIPFRSFSSSLSLSFSPSLRLFVETELFTFEVATLASYACALQLQLHSASDIWEPAAAFRADLLSVAAIN